MKTYLIAVLVFLSIQAFGQKPKKNTYDTYNHEFPKTYLPSGYESYSAILKLDGKKNIYVDGEFARESVPMEFNEFWKEEDIFARLAKYQFLNYELDVNAKRNNKLILLVEIANARIDAKINEDKDQVLPYTYKYSWSVDVTTTLTNSLTGEEIFKNVYQSGGPFKSSGSRDEKKIIGFKTYKEAKAYVTKNADKSLIGNEFYKKTEISNPFRYHFEVLYFRIRGLPFWTISNEKKYPEAAVLNTTINETIVKLDELVEKHKNDTKMPSTGELKNLLRKKNAIGFKVSDDLLGLEYRKSFISLLKDIAIESEKLIPLLDESNKKEKSILWAMYVNKATVLMYSGKFDEAKALVEKAKSLKYKKSFTQDLERVVNGKASTFDFIAQGKTKDGKEMSPKYRKFLYN